MEEGDNMPEYYIAWWNLENLFDVVNSPNRHPRLQQMIGDDLDGWTSSVLDKKISQLVKIIKQMNNREGPDILGVCEIENQPVLELLVNKLKAELAPNRQNYQIAHHDSPDDRGIDVAFIYDGDKYEIVNEDSHFILLRRATRDLYQITLKSELSDENMIIVGNHWPSRMEGVLESEPYRIIAAETLSYWYERILTDQGEEESPMLIMGDFNDDPFNRSLTEYALSSVSKTRVLKARKPRLYNMMWRVMGEGIGTFYYQNRPPCL